MEKVASDNFSSYLSILANPNFLLRSLAGQRKTSEEKEKPAEFGYPKKRQRWQNFDMITFVFFYWRIEYRPEIQGVTYPKCQKESQMFLETLRIFIIAPSYTIFALPSNISSSLGSKFTLQNSQL